ncbi:morn repeat [Trichoderma arundinaceum]|uniref:Morn repeat n=1 Tax=Trichoderma arundinaceum TaxID=490622 RepID=A0A395NGA4_TRIAR|nr:morn repeat [Trichoderma arundinaceum]
MAQILEKIDDNLNVGGKQGRYTGEAVNTLPIYGYFPVYEPHGKGIMRYDDGSVYEGQWENGQYSGTGKYTTKDEEYVGTWSNGIRVGRGRLTTNGGTRTYDGWFEAGKRSGTGTLKYGSTGVSYSGEWKDDVPKGKGTWRWANGDWWEGTWGGTWGKDAIGKGRTLSHYKEGGSYEGETLGPKFTGQAKVISKSGNVYRGMCRDNQKHGDGTLKTTDGMLYEGSWHNGKKTGRFKITDLSTGVVKKRNF